MRVEYFLKSIMKVAYLSAIIYPNINIIILYIFSRHIESMVVVDMLFTASNKLSVAKPSVATEKFF